MATRFELLLHGDDGVSLRAAGEEALEEIERLDRQLSLYNPASEIAHLNARAARQPVRVEPLLFGLFAQAHRLHRESQGAFDITLAPLLRCWGLMGGEKGRIPRAAELAEARANTGMHLLQLDSRNKTVRFAREGMMVDLGAIGKGYAIERAAGLLRDAGVSSAILHGGTSTIYALGRPPDAEAWKVAIEYPSQTFDSGVQNVLRAPMARQRTGRKQYGAQPSLLAVVSLRDEALSVSAVWGKSFQVKGRTYGHIIDPRTGRPASSAVLAAVIAPSATESDALSTALLTLGAKGHDRIAHLRPNLRTLVVEESKSRARIRFRSSGIAIEGPWKS